MDNIPVFLLAPFLWIYFLKKVGKGTTTHTAVAMDTSKTLFKHIVLVLCLPNWKTFLPFSFSLHLYEKVGKGTTSHTAVAVDAPKTLFKHDIGIVLCLPNWITFLLFSYR